MITSKINGFIYITNYSNKFRKLIEEISKRSAELSKNIHLNGIGIFLFGSPSRQEMIDESDADILIIRKENNQEYYNFKEIFIKELEKENFPKIDVPDWGTLQECETYIKKSITEGNQVIEASFVYGDELILEEVLKLKEKYCTIDKFERVICFQKLYFDQYYKQRTINGIKNVKYGHGGTRDFMFVAWLSNLFDIAEGKMINFDDNFPHIYKSLNQMYDRKLLNFEDYQNFLKNIEIVLILRNIILIQNKDTNKEGLTYLDDKTITKLFNKGIFPYNKINSSQDLKVYLEKAIEEVSNLKTNVWKIFLNYLCNKNGIDWINKFKRITTGKIDEKIIKEVNKNDILMQIAIIWNLSKSNKLFDKIFYDYANSDSWEVLASLCCHSECPSDLLDKVATGKGKEKGYEYLLRIIARNENTSKETLRKIINNKELEERYRIVALTAYQKGVKKANEDR